MMKIKLKKIREYNDETLRNFDSNIKQLKKIMNSLETLNRRKNDENWTKTVQKMIKSSETKKNMNKN